MSEINNLAASTEEIAVATTITKEVAPVFYGKFDKTNELYYKIQINKCTKKFKMAKA